MKRRTRSAAFIAAILLGISLAGCGGSPMCRPRAMICQGRSVLSADAGEYFAAVTGAELLRR